MTFDIIVLAEYCDDMLVQESAQDVEETFDIIVLAEYCDYLFSYGLYSRGRGF